MAKSQLTLPETCLLSGLWVLSPHEKARLDRFFLVFDSWDRIEPDLHYSQDEVAYFIEHKDLRYKVILLSPINKLRKAEELGMSFRVNFESGFRVVLIKEWAGGHRRG